MNNILDNKKISSDKEGNINYVVGNNKLSLEDLEKNFKSFINFFNSPKSLFFKSGNRMNKKIKLSSNNGPSVYVKVD